MKLNHITLVVAAVLLSMLSLSAQSDAPLFEKNGIKIYQFISFPVPPGLKVTLKSPANNASLKEGVDTFRFDVQNFVLGAQTPDAAQRMCAYSSKGQHLHFIMDNEPYVASYSPTVTADMKPGHHVLLAFVSRSYHESLKSRDGYVLSEFNVGADAKDNFDEKAPHLFYSRPKGEYLEDDNKRILLDFYLVNCNLSADGYKVRATINGNEFVFTKWQPYIIEGLLLGENKIKLELLDKEGNLVSSPFNGVQRSFSSGMDMMKRVSFPTDSTKDKK